MTSLKCSLIDEARKRPVLWDCTIDSYRDKGLKELAWQEIADILHKPMAELKQEWKKLRDSHRNAIKRKETKSGQAAINSKSWKYEKRMEFLVSTAPPRTPVQNNIPPMMEDSTEDQNETVMQDDSANDTEDENPQRQVQQEVSGRQRPPRDVDKIIDFMMNKNKLKSTRPVPDDIDMFFGSAAFSVKKLPRRLQNRVKREVLDAISRAEEDNEQLMARISPIMEQQQLATPSVSPSLSGSSRQCTSSGVIDNHCTSLSQTGTTLRSSVKSSHYFGSEQQ